MRIGVLEDDADQAGWLRQVLEKDGHSVHLFSRGRPLLNKLGYESFDLLVIDYWLLLVLKPKSLFIPGSLALAQEQGFGFHFKGFLKGSVLGAVISAAIVLVCLAVSNLVAA